MRLNSRHRHVAGLFLLIGGALAPAYAVERLPPVTTTARGRATSPGPYAVRQATALSEDPAIPDVDAAPLEGIPGKMPENIVTPPLQIDSLTYADGTTVGDNGVYPIDLPAALMLADRANPEINIKRQEIEASLAVRTLARTILVPNLNAGTNLHVHNGPLQKSFGEISTLAEKSLYVGGGADTVAAETVKVPMVQISAHLTDAIYEPLAAQQRVIATTFDRNNTFNNITLEVSNGYVTLMAAEAKLAILQESYANAVEVANTTRNFAEVGQARQADADRTQTEASLFNSEVQLAIAERAVASAELCRLLNLDPSLRLATVQARPLPVLDLVDPSFTVEQLIGVAMGMRPDLRARTAEVEEMQIHYRQERMRPLLPTIMVGYSAGTFGGGSNLQGPPYNVPQTFGAFAPRTDFDAIAYWTAQNFGVGNMALWRERRAQRDQNFYRRVATVNLLREQIASTYGLSTAGRKEIAVCRARLANAEAGYIEELHRVKAGEGLPIELIDNLNRLVRARVALIDAIANYDRAQFSLFVALGQPPTLALPNAQALQSPPPANPQ